MSLPTANVVSVGPLGGQPPLEAIRNALTAGPQTTETMVLLAGLVAVLLLIVLCARYFDPERRAVAEPQPDYLAGAVEVLGLSERDRRDLQRIARQAGLEQPVAMLLSPANLAHAAGPTLNTENDGELRRRIEHLCARLFDVPLPDPERLPRRPS
ncbi:MAG: hypothetical protein ACE5I3_00905 [Phycisphaerae bacterium]